MQNLEKRMATEVEMNEIKNLMTGSSQKYENSVEELLIYKMVQEDLVKDLGREAQAKQYYFERCQGAFDMMAAIRETLGVLLIFPMDDINREILTDIHDKLMEAYIETIEPHSAA